MAALLPSASLRMVAEGTHGTVVEHPEEVDALVLDSSPSTPRAEGIALRSQPSTGGRPLSSTSTQAEAGSRMSASAPRSSRVGSMTMT
jgi:hypothetical protein